jgi:hypothetical protein
VEFLDCAIPAASEVDEQPAKKRRASAGRNYRNLAAGIDDPVVEEEPEEVPVVEEVEKEVVRHFPPLPIAQTARARQPAVRVEPFSFSDLLFGNYKAEVERKQG